MLTSLDAQQSPMSAAVDQMQTNFNRLQARSDCVFRKSCSVFFVCLCLRVYVMCIYCVVVYVVMQTRRAGAEPGRGEGDRGSSGRTAGGHGAATRGRTTGLSVLFVSHCWWFISHCYCVQEVAWLNDELKILQMRVHGLDTMFGPLAAPAATLSSPSAAGLAAAVAHAQTQQTASPSATTTQTQALRRTSVTGFGGTVGVRSSGATFDESKFSAAHTQFPRVSPVAIATVAMTSGPAAGSYPRPGDAAHAYVSTLAAASASAPVNPNTHTNTPSVAVASHSTVPAAVLPPLPSTVSPERAMYASAAAIAQSYSASHKQLGLSKTVSVPTLHAAFKQAAAHTEHKRAKLISQLHADRMHTEMLHQSAAYSSQTEAEGDRDGDRDRGTAAHAHAHTHTFSQTHPQPLAAAAKGRAVTTTSKTRSGGAQTTASGYAKPKTAAAASRARSNARKGPGTGAIAPWSTAGAGDRGGGDRDFY